MSILLTLLRWNSHNSDSTHNYLYKDPNYLTLYTHTYIHPSWFHFWFEIDVVSFNLHSQSHDSCWTKNIASFTLTSNQILLHLYFYFIWKIFSSIRIFDSIKFSIAFINTDNKLMKKSLTGVYFNQCLSRLTWLVVYRYTF